MFLDNKYTKIYYQIISRSKDRTLTGYSEKHHIIPKSCGGSNKKENLAILTAREHFICHWLLVKMTEGQHKRNMAYALWMLSNGCASPSHKRLKIYGRKYELIKILFSTLEVTKEIKAKRLATRKERGTRCSESTKELLRKKFKGRDLGDVWRAKLRGKKHSEETKAKLSELNKAGIIGRKGIPHAESTKKKIGDANRGKKHSPEFCEQMSKRMKGRPASPISVQKLIERNLGKKIPKEVIEKRVASRKENAKGKPKIVLSDETKKKIGDALRGKKQTKKKILTPEHRAKVSAAMKGLKKKPKLFDPIANKKISEALKGRPRSEETKRKISETKRQKRLEKLAQNDNPLFVFH